MDSVRRQLGGALDWPHFGTCSRHTLGSLAFFSSTSRLNLFISLMHVASLPPSLISSSTPFNQRRSFSKDGSAREVVVERRWSWSSVTDRDEFVGRISLVSRFPQYLARA